MKEILWRRVPPFEKLQKEFTMDETEAIKDFIDTKAYKAITVMGRINFVKTYNYILYLEMMVDKLKRSSEQKNIREDNEVQHKDYGKATNNDKYLELQISENDQNGQYAKLGHAVLCVKAGETQIRDDGVYAILAVWEEHNLVLNWYRNKIYSSKNVLRAYDSIPLNKSQYRIYEISGLTEVCLPNKEVNEVEEQG